MKKCTFQKLPPRYVENLSWLLVDTLMAHIRFHITALSFRNYCCYRLKRTKGSMWIQLVVQDNIYGIHKLPHISI